MGGRCGGRPPFALKKMNFRKKIDCFLSSNHSNAMLLAKFCTKYSKKTLQEASFSVCEQILTRMATKACQSVRLVKYTHR